MNMVNVNSEYNCTAVLQKIWTKVLTGYTVNIRISTGERRHCLVKTVLQCVNKQQKRLLDTLGQYVLSFSTQSTNIHITTEEMQHLGRVRHPHGKSQRISVTSLHHTRHIIIMLPTSSYKMYTTFHLGLISQFVLSYYCGLDHLPKRKLLVITKARFSQATTAYCKPSNSIREMKGFQKNEIYTFYNDDYEKTTYK